MGDRSSGTSWTDLYLGRRLKIWLTSRPKMSMLLNSSIKLILKTFQSVILLKEPLLFSGMAWRVMTSLTGSLHLVRLNPFRTEDSHG